MKNTGDIAHLIDHTLLKADATQKDITGYTKGFFSAKNNKANGPGAYAPALAFTAGPSCNFYRKEDLSRMDPMLQDMFRRIGKQIVLAHAKDVKASVDGTDLPAAGQGVLDYPLFLRLLAGLNRPLYLIVEHLTLQDVPRARDYVLNQFEKI